MEEALYRNKIYIGSKCWHRTGDSGYQNSTLFLEEDATSKMIK